MYGVDSIHLGINLQCIITPSHPQTKWGIVTWKTKKYISQASNQKKRKYYQTSDLKTRGHVLFDMLGSNFDPDYRGLRCMDLNSDKKYCCVK